MHSNKIFLCDGASLLESEIMEFEVTNSLKEATHFVNSELQILVAKTVIINLPVKFNFEELHQFNKFIIRYPIKELDNLNADYEYVEYKLDNIEEVENESEISCLILNKHLLSNTKKLKELKGKKFLLGTDYVTNGKLNLIGYSILKNSYKKLYNSLKEAETNK